MLKLISSLLWILATALTLTGLAAGAEPSMPLCLDLLYAIMAASTAALAIGISFYEPKP